MAYRDDLSQGLEQVNGVTKPVRYIGWLDAAHPFPAGRTPDAFRTRLFELCAHPVKQTMGFHECPFCNKKVSDTTGARIMSGIATGNGEIHVAMPEGLTYVAPDLIAHYVAVHDYQPPDQFVATVLHEDPRTREACRRVWDRIRVAACGIGALLFSAVIIYGVVAAFQEAEQVAMEGKPADAIVVSEARTGGHRWLAVKILGRYKQDVSVGGLPMTLLVSEPMTVGTIVPVLHVPGNPRLIVVGQPGDLPMTLYQRTTGIGFTVIGVLAALTLLLFGVRWVLLALKSSDK